MNEDAENIPSPCVRNCCLNEQDICLGCFRTLEEICGWSRANARLRQQILVNAERRQLLRPGVSGGSAAETASER
ncbi:DUF1289 domain-containing protein [Methylomonas rivi]|uniref:DUF1289 domain-containing protein n=1 Tax=Methylomonas rivi TaxID=2952226 RepID=A0ABT1U0X4_9GAMM|nr:DUF1289 domain-containing protein [Methylomonas sp. WSC-6]MCQ8127468.1 DUF1289 domain-containing protein [Methylomonas sp. WSC-6]